MFILEFIKTSKADCCVVVDGLLADKLVNPTSVTMHDKNNKFQSLSNSLTIRIGSSISDVKATVRYFIS